MSSFSDHLEHEIHLPQADGGDLRILIFSDREMRWIFHHHYASKKLPGRAPDVLCDVDLIAEYRDGRLHEPVVLTMHVVLPCRLGQKFFAGVDISPSAKTFLEFHYARQSSTVFHLVKICKGARERVVISDQTPALASPIDFPFPIPDVVHPQGDATGGVDVLRFPFRASDDVLHYFEVPLHTRRRLS